jgi:hypothetical protein
MQQQQAIAQVNQQVFATPAHVPHGLPDKALGLHTQRPAQGFAHADRNNGGTPDGIHKTQAGNFNFR